MAQRRVGRAANLNVILMLQPSQIVKQPDFRGVQNSAMFVLGEA